jgi:uncharacterized membrane protein YgcG
MNEELNNAYADIDKLIQNQNSMLEQQQTQQNNILDQQLQMQIDQMNKNKAEIDENTAKTNAGLYTEYRKASNPYGANAEQLWTKGLGKSGYAESTQTNLYNTYQKNITDTLNTAQKLKSDFDFAIQQARQNRDLQGAQFALELYKQKMNLLTQEYDLKNNKENQLYQRGIDERNYNRSVFESDRDYNFNTERAKRADYESDRNYDRNVYVDDRNFEYQKSQDAIANDLKQKSLDLDYANAETAKEQWEKEYQQSLKEYADQLALQRANASRSSTSRSSSSRSSSGSSGGGGSNLTVKQDDKKGQDEQQDINQLYSNLSNKGKEIAGLVEPFALTKDIDLIGNVLRNEKQNGNITDSDANILAEIFARKTK